MNKVHVFGTVHIFGENDQWAISVDDGCLRFHPQYNEHPEKVTTWIWKEAYNEVEILGGFDATIEKIRQMNDILRSNEIKKITCPRCNCQYYPDSFFIDRRSIQPCPHCRYQARETDEDITLESIRKEE